MTTPTPDELARLARGLSYKQVAALRGIYAWESPWEQDDGEAELSQLGLWGDRGPTVLGLALRDWIKENSNG